MRPASIASWTRRCHFVAQQPVEGLSLQVEHVWYFKGFADLAERNAVRGWELSRAAK